jgi:hypothetical protein
MDTINTDGALVRSLVNVTKKVRISMPGHPHQVYLIQIVTD